MSLEPRNMPSHQAAYVVDPQVTCPIALGDSGFWYDGTNWFLRNAAGADTPIDSNGVTIHDPARLMDTSVLALADFTYAAGVLTAKANGTIGTIDSVAPAVGDRIVRKLSDAQDGIYTCTSRGGTSAKSKFTRVADLNTTAMFENGALVVVTAGTVYASTLWELGVSSTFTMDTDTPTWTQTAAGVTLAAVASVLGVAASTAVATTHGGAGNSGKSVNLDTNGKIDGVDLTLATASSGTGASGTTAPAFTGTAAVAAAAQAFAGTGFATLGQVVTTTDNQTMTLNQCANMWLITATQAPCLILSNTAVVNAPAVLTVYGLAPTTNAGTYKILTAPTPAGSVGTHTHTGPAHTHALN